MPKTAIVYRSPHHGNTKRLLDAIQKAHPEVALIHAGEDTFAPEAYDFIGFASGVYAGKLHRMVRKVLDGIAGDGRKAFVIFTCGDPKGEKYNERFVNTLREKGFDTRGYYWCAGLDTFGPLKLMGGMNKGRPNEDDIRGAVAFYEGLIG
ncbi:MAG: flavodoxin [Bacillota bacterium]